MGTTPKEGSILPLFCAPPVSWCKQWLQERLPVAINIPYQKQHYFNRFYALGANSVLLNTIPVQKHPSTATLADIELSFEQKWQLRLMRTLYFSYAKSAFYEHYWPEFRPVFQHPPHYLSEFNRSLLQVIAKIIQVEQPTIITDFSEKQLINYENWDPRLPSNPQQSTYFQLFGSKFQSELSIFDVLFNLGPDSARYLNSI